MKILYVASEAVPFIKSGGLADVIGSLSKAMNKNKDAEVTVVIPKYQDLKNQELLEYITNFRIQMSWRNVYCGVFKAVVEGVTYYFVDNEDYFKRPGLYGYGDDAERFAFLNFAALELISHLQLDIDIIHCHDWQSAMIPVLYKERYQHYTYYENIKTIFTIHNIAYQGKYPSAFVDTIYGLDNSLYDNGNLRHFECFNMMKSAIVYADAITTVSNSYANEILSDEYSYGLSGILRMRQFDLYGILNGIDYDLYNPKTDLKIPLNFSVDNLANKSEVKTLLQKELGLTIDPDIPLIGIVTRLTWQKGVDLILQSFDEIIGAGAMFVILGAGDEYYEGNLRHFVDKYPKLISLNLKYDEPLAHKIYAASDYFLMPSLFEPCGLSQLIALRYGSLPIVRETGGLIDTINPFNEYTGEGNGFSFSNFSREDMIAVTKYALSFYPNKKIFNNIVKQAMESNFDWNESSNKYLQLYKSII